MCQEPDMPMLEATRVLVLVFLWVMVFLWLGCSVLMARSRCSYGWVVMAGSRCFYGCIMVYP